MGEGAIASRALCLAGFANPLKSFDARRSTVSGVFFCPNRLAVGRGAIPKASSYAAPAGNQCPAGHQESLAYGSLDCSSTDLHGAGGARRHEHRVSVAAAFGRSSGCADSAGERSRRCGRAARRNSGSTSRCRRQYLEYMRHAATGDFGDSWRSGRTSAWSWCCDRLGATLLLTASAFVLALLVAVPLGVLAGSGRFRPVGWVASALGVVGQAMPAFWLGTVLILLFSVRLGWLPSSGRAGLRSLILPAVALAAFPAATLMRIVRVSVADVLVRTTSAPPMPKDCPDGSCSGGMSRAMPCCRRLPMRASLAGSWWLEQWRSNRCSLGRESANWRLQSVASRDLPVIQAFVAVVAVLIVLANLTADLVAMLADPRLREAAASGALR